MIREFVFEIFKQRNPLIDLLIVISQIKSGVWWTKKSLVLLTCCNFE